MPYNYDKTPFIEVDGNAFSGYDKIVCQLKGDIAKIKKEKTIMIIDFYPGIRTEEIKKYLIEPLNPVIEIFSDSDVFVSDEELEKMIKPNMTEDRVFGILNYNKLIDFVDHDKLYMVKEKIEKAKGFVIIYGVGAGLVSEADIYIYADLSRWEIQRRYRKGEIPNWKSNNFIEDTLIKYKRGFFFEWRAADRHKKENFKNFDYILDTNMYDNAKMIDKNTFFSALEKTLKKPFRVVPFFDPGVWGGQWMKEVCDLDREPENYAWCFDCVPEENSLLIKVNGIVMEVPSINLVFLYPKELLGEKVYARFGSEFPIRFDFLDTMEGGNLSLQVHPLTEYIQDNFGMHYTQDESYYLLDAKEDAVVYLGFKPDVNKNEFENDLLLSEKGGLSFPAAKYINEFKAKKHDHFLIPAGTIHCSGKNAMVLEISSTPFIFTFKLWDWGRVGLDGKPRPVHLKHGFNNLQYDRDTEWVKENLVNDVKRVDEGDGFIEERTGLHQLEFIETRRHFFSKTVKHNTDGGVNVINLIEGEQAVVKSPKHAFEPFVVNYAETFIVPASIGEYTITPYGDSIGKTIGTIKAYVRY